ncbi:metal ABC transporter permease [Microtetraspora niveoalba]|uniref:metal ABC transporter permease n=1 Tax=Microtetraspora niveoalba TaxID=46175 RepID=UPI000A022CF0|nr:metal ABC transporter permease [Microtetraspora niveoalba]
MHWLFSPFEVSFVRQALWGGILVSLICALAGTWVVLRGLAFLGDAMSHGMLPGVALASLLGGDILLGAALSAGAMALGVTALGGASSPSGSPGAAGRSGPSGSSGMPRLSRLSQDTSVGLLFAGMLALGVIVVSHSRSFAVDLTGFLFGDVLAVRPADLIRLAAALLVAAAVSALGHRSFVALAFDPRTAHTLGLRPRTAHAVLLGLVTLAIVASFHVVGTLLVFALLVAPPAAAALWARRIPEIMIGAALIGVLSTVAGLVASWHLGTAAGATVAAVAVSAFFVSAAGAAVASRPPGLLGLGRRRRRTGSAPSAAVSGPRVEAERAS